jgi:hypothetical protein
MSNLSLAEALHYVGRDDLTKTAADATENYTFNTKNATFVSFVNALVKEANEVTMQRCQDHAKFWKIAEECEEARVKLASYEAPSLSETDFALLQRDGEDVICKYAAFDNTSTVDAAEAFYRNRSAYPLTWRHDTAINLLKKAAEFKAYLPDYIETYLHKAAGFGFASPETAENMLVERLNKSHPAKTAADTSKLTDVVECMLKDEALCADPDFVKTAMEVIEKYDACNGLTDWYGSGISLPEELIDSRYVTNKLEKLAGCSKLAVELVNGRSVDVTTLTKEALEAVDPDLAKLGAAELIDVLPTLPKGDADLLVRLT